MPASRKSCIQSQWLMRWTTRRAVPDSRAALPGRNAQPGRVSKTEAMSSRTDWKKPTILRKPDQPRNQTGTGTAVISIASLRSDRRGCCSDSARQSRAARPRSASRHSRGACATWIAATAAAPDEMPTTDLLRGPGARAMPPHLRCPPESLRRCSRAQNFGNEARADALNLVRTGLRRRRAPGSLRARRRSP